MKKRLKNFNEYNKAFGIGSIAISATFFGVGKFTLMSVAFSAIAILSWAIVLTALLPKQFWGYAEGKNSI